ncbi:SusD/RagB family nutrient-binding outer membrane lipoprotein [uncultured Bacteroides sp.]|uniref:SusD/RagB family nutrient-binding outer membrane lipoprotein n=1 Tax=uncultured Bacteroides sp. TaxID=162156 RepID=UPI0025DF766D|nr:SusD/RagB family nutrient-binding outer membrane lipoprotein [uncultured Bacteroides sp.]
MKRNMKYIALGCIFALGLTSCEDWLDVNVDEDSPNNQSALVSNRLPWIQKFYMYGAGTTNMRTACQAGVYYSNNGNNNALAVTWNCQAGTTTTPYQSFFVTTASNLIDTYNKAEREGAYHYMAAANILHAMGFMEMLDLYGEIPYTQALGASPSPGYDDGKVIFNGCIAKLDEAIELLGKEQEATATRLSEGDMWNGGDAQKWLKMAYGLKARYLLKLSKKADLFDADAILECLAKAPQSNADNTVSPCYNSPNDVTDYMMGDPIMTNSNWDCAAYGSNQRFSKYYCDLLTDMRGAGVTDPRMTKIVPAAMCNMQLDASGKVKSYEWLRSAGVDCLDKAERLKDGGELSIQLVNFATVDKKITYEIKDNDKRNAFIAGLAGKHVYSVEGEKVTVTYAKGSSYVDATNYMYAGDTIYVNLRSNACLTGNGSVGEMNLYWHFYNNADGINAGAVGSTGSFQIRPVSDFELLTYHEMCFIKAEVYMRKGDKDKALAAYKDGIKAHIDMMQAKLTEWKGAGYENPDMWPMDENEISAYMASGAVCQNSADLTMADVMLQKYLAMGCSIENWNDMRRFNYSAGNVGDFGVVYPGYKRSPLFAGQSAITGSSPSDPTYWMRRWRLPATLELQYNAENALAANSKAFDTDVWCYPIWWDCATDDEYYGYIK